MDGLSDDQVQQAADLLMALRRKELVLEDLPDDLTPQTTADIQRIIDATNLQIDRPVRGWKLYTVYKPMNPPFYAPIYDVFESGAVIPMSLSELRLIEPEIIFRADRDLPPRAHHYAIDEIRDAVTAHVGFEIIGSRFRQSDLGSAYALSKGQKSHYGSLSDNIANGCVVVGDAIPNWRDIAFEDVSLRLTENDHEIIHFVGGHPFDNPFLPVIVGVNRMRRGAGIRAGEVIITSSSTSFFPVSAGTVIRATYEGLGEVSASFADI
jgi:2-keto-4-pentenoate hydratase